MPGQIHCGICDGGRDLDYWCGTYTRPDYGLGSASSSQLRGRAGPSQDEPGGGGLGNQCKGLELDLLQLKRLRCLQRSILVQKRGPEEKERGGSSRHGATAATLGTAASRMQWAQPASFAHASATWGCACRSARRISSPRLGATRGLCDWPEIEWPAHLIPSPMANRGACHLNSVPGCWSARGQGPELGGLGLWSLVSSEKLGPAMDLMPRSVERSLILDLGRIRRPWPRLQTQPAMGRPTSSGMRELCVHGATGCQAGTNSTSAAPRGRCYSAGGDVRRPCGNSV